jgi:hypothetical protein
VYPLKLIEMDTKQCNKQMIRELVWNSFFPDFRISVIVNTIDPLTRLKVSTCFRNLFTLRFD